MNLWSIGLSLLWAIAAAGVAWYCASIAQQVTYVTLADGRRQERRVPLMFRLLLPLAPNITPVFRQPVFENARDRLRGKIISAGFDGLIDAYELMSLRVLLPAVVGSFWVFFILFLASAAKGTFFDKIYLLLCVVGVFGLYVYPVTWLKAAVAGRHKSIQRALPFMLDLLTLSVEAGMDFMMSLQRNVERRNVDPLGEELIRVIREIQLGKTRREALRDMSGRVNLTDVRSVVSALVQADELGVGIGSILRIQADQMRQRRFERAEKLANEAPVKMLFPLMCFIFPAVFLVLLGPIITRLIQQGF